MNTTNRPGASNYKWYILTLGTLTFTFVVAIPLMSMPVLFDEISRDLDLNLVQVGWIWGIGSLTGIFTSLIGGALGDRFGARKTLMVGCVLAGIMGALRGISEDYLTLTLTSLLLGLVPPTIPMNVHKTCGIWFSERQLGLANGIVASGMALGFMLGSLLSATVLSPWLGGWRPVLLLYGGLSIVMGMLWFFTTDVMPADNTRPKGPDKVPFSRGLPHVIRLRNVWLIGLAMLGNRGCIEGMLGYLPLYLRRIGWPAARADGALASFHGVSLIAAIPLALLSDRLGARKRLLMLATLMIATGIALLYFVEGKLVWAAVIIAGVFRDGFMAILMTLIIELKGVGPAYTGTAIGLVLVFSRMGSLISPPLGNSLTEFNLALPFIFWAMLALMGLLGFYFVRERE